MCAIHINFIDYGDNLQIIVERQIEVGDGLCLHPLCGIHNEQAPLARRNRARHLIGEVNVSRSINQIEGILHSILHIIHLNGVALDGDASLAFQIHIVEHLILHILATHRFGILQ